MHLPLGDPVIDCSSISEPCYPSVSEVLTDLQRRSTLWALCGCWLCCCQVGNCCRFV